MTLEELFSRLSYGELSNLSIGNSGIGSINEKNHSKLINHVNEALIRIYTRFPLLERDVLIETVEHITYYHLNSKFAESINSIEPHPYIKDSINDPFKDDVVKILEVYNDGVKVVLNDIEDPNSLFTPQNNILQVPNPKEGKLLTIIYQAYHPKLRLDSTLDTFIDIPIFLESALQSFVAYRIFSNMNGQENSAKAQEFASHYESLCHTAIDQDLISTTISTSNIKFSRRGWV